MEKRINKLRNNIEQLKGQKNQLENILTKKKNENNLLKKDLDNTEKAQLILQTVAQQTQQELEYHISELVTHALESICDFPYEFKISFVLKRGKTEAECYFIKNKERIHPFTESGGGIVDITSFALRIALWNLSNNKNNTIILDEPFKWVQTREWQIRISEILKMLSIKFNIQFIIISQAGHKEELLHSADKVFHCGINSAGISKITNSVTKEEKI